MRVAAAVPGQYARTFLAAAFLALAATGALAPPAGAQVIIFQRPGDAFIAFEFDEAGRMKPSPYYERVVDVMEELVKFTLLTRDCAAYLVDRYSERRESAEALSKRVNLRSV